MSWAILSHRLLGLHSFIVLFMKITFALISGPSDVSFITVMIFFREHLIVFNIRENEEPYDLCCSKVPPRIIFSKWTSDIPGGRAFNISRLVPLGLSWSMRLCLHGLRHYNLKSEGSLTFLISIRETVPWRIAPIQSNLKSEGSSTFSVTFKYCGNGFSKSVVVCKHFMSNTENEEI